jgi:hypothetical protein
MKPPRSLAIGTLSISALFVLIFTLWWWVTWPERMAQAFVQLMRQGHFHEARQMTTQPAQTSISLILVNDGLRPSYSATSLEAESRSLADLVCGRQRFYTKAAPVRFLVERGRLSNCAVAIMSEEEIQRFYRDALSDDDFQRIIHTRD